MQREITVKEFENAVSKVDDIEPMIIKRDNKKDLIVISLEQYEKEIFLNKLGYENTKSKLYPDLRHEILNEEEYEQIYNDILSFIEGE